MKTKVFVVEVDYGRETSWQADSAARLCADLKARAIAAARHWTTGAEPLVRVWELQREGDRFEKLPR